MKLFFIALSSTFPNSKSYMVDPKYVLNPILDEGDNEATPEQIFGLAKRTQVVCTLTRSGIKSQR